MDLNQIVDSLQDIFDEYDIVHAGEERMHMSVEESFYCFGTCEVCISVSNLNKKASGIGFVDLTCDVKNMIPIIEARTDSKLKVTLSNEGSRGYGRSYTHIFVKDISYWK